jgi:hypothetical protein
MPQSSVRYPTIITAAREGRAPAPVVGLGPPGTWLDPCADQLQTDRLRRQIRLAQSVFRTIQGDNTPARTLTAWSQAMGWDAGLRGVALLPFVGGQLARSHGYTTPFPVALGTLSLNGAPDVTPWVPEFITAAQTDDRLANMCLRCSPYAGEAVNAVAPETYRRLSRHVLFKSLPGMPKHLSDAGDVLIVAPGFSSTAPDQRGARARNSVAHRPVKFRLLLSFAADGTVDQYTSAAIAAYNVVGMVSAATTAADALQVQHLDTLRSHLAASACAAISGHPRQVEASQHTSLRAAGLLPDTAPLFDLTKRICYRAPEYHKHPTTSSQPWITFEHVLNEVGEPKRLNDTYVRPNQMPKTDAAGKATSTYQAGHVTVSIKNVRERHEGLVLAGMLNEPL